MGEKVFIFGTGRCGSVTLSKLIGSLPSTIVLHEGRGDVNGKKIDLGDLKEFNEFIYYKSKEPIRQYNKTILLNGATYGQMDKLFNSRKRLIETQDDIFNYCDINPYGYSFINFIANKYPEAKFVHLIRSGYDVVRSYYHRKNTYPDSIVESEYAGYQSGKPRPMPNDPYFEKWSQFSRLEKTMWFWNYVNCDIANRLADVSSNRKMIFRIEDLNQENFILLTKFLNLPAYFNQDKNDKFNKSNAQLNWDSKTIKLFNQICGKTMLNFDYQLK